MYVVARQRARRALVGGVGAQDLGAQLRLRESVAPKGRTGSAPRRISVMSARIGLYTFIWSLPRAESWRRPMPRGGAFLIFFVIRVVRPLAVWNCTLEPLNGSTFFAMSLVALRLPRARPSSSCSP